LKGIHSSKRLTWPPPGAGNHLILKGIHSGHFNLREKSFGFGRGVIGKVLTAIISTVERNLLELRGNSKVILLAKR
jgi:hypothetical protein